MRQTIKEVETNVAYRWFLGLGFEDKVPHFSTFGKNYERRFRGTDIFETIFYRILKEAMNEGFVDPDVMFIDGTHVKANANKNKYVKQTVRSYQDKLDLEINEERINHGKKPLPPSTTIREKEVKQSKIDPEIGYMVKSEREKMFGYGLHTACDANGFILGTKVEPSNKHDSQVFDSLLDQLLKKIGKPQAVAVDAGYKTPAIANRLQEEHTHGVMPYKRSMTPPGYFRTHDFVYDDYYDCVLCPNNTVLSYRTTNREGYR